MFVYGIFVCFVLTSVAASYRSDGGFLPSASYGAEDQIAEPSSRTTRASSSKSYPDNLPSSDDKYNRVQRFGYGGNPEGGPFGGTGTAVYTPIKLDLGGVLLGTLLGFSAVIVIPKLVTALSYSYGGGYARSADLGTSQLGEIMATLDDTLARYNVDTTSCMQRLACSYVQLAKGNVQSGNATDFDSVLDSLVGNTLVEKMLDGTSVMDAIVAGKRDETDCQEKYAKCTLDRKTVVKILSQVLPAQ